MKTKRWPFTFQKATFQRAKGHVLQGERRPFARRLLQGVECQDVTQAVAGHVQFHGFPLLQGLRISLFLPKNYTAAEASHTFKIS